MFVRPRRAAGDATSFQRKGHAATVRSFVQSSLTRELVKQFFPSLVGWRYMSIRQKIERHALTPYLVCVSRYHAVSGRSLPRETSFIVTGLVLLESVLP